MSRTRTTTRSSLLPMWTVPRNAEDPSYDDAEKIGFWRWLTSSKADRTEWVRRRKIADEKKREAWKQAKDDEGWRTD